MRLVSRKIVDQKHHAVYEMPPCKRTLMMGDNYYYGQFPWTYFHIELNKYKWSKFNYDLNLELFEIYYSRNQLQQDEVPEFKVKFAWHGSSIGICLSEYSFRFFESIEKSEQMIIERFFSSSFDNSSCFLIYKFNGISYSSLKELSFQDWSNGIDLLY